MSTKNLFGNLFSIGSSKEPADGNSASFTITNKTVRFGHGTEIYPMANIVRFGKYTVSEWKLPIWIVLILVITSIYLVIDSNKIALVPIAVVIFGIWQRFKKPKLAFGIEASSSSEHYIITKNEKFIDEVVATVAKYFEEENNVKYHINVEKATIEKVKIETYEDNSVEINGNVGGDVTTSPTS